jgi:tetratricopeptide (TPR) repeat protein
MDVGRYEDADQHTQSVLELHPNYPSARLALGHIKVRAFDWKGAEAEYLKAIEADPTSPYPYLNYAELLVCLGQKTEGEASLKRGLALAGEPYSPRVLKDAGVVYYMLGDFDRALQTFEQVAIAQPHFRSQYWWSAICHWRLGNYEDALGQLRVVEQTADGLYRLSREDMALGIQMARGVIYATMGDRVRAEQAIERMRGFPEGMPRRALGIAAVLFHLGEVDEGFEWLRRAVEVRCPNLSSIRCYYLPEEVRRDPRYAEILKPTGLPTDRI